MAERGLCKTSENQRAAQRAALMTRDPKCQADKAALMAVWEKQAKELNFDARTLKAQAMERRALSPDAGRSAADAEPVREAVEWAVAHLSERENITLVEAGRGRGVCQDYAHVMATIVRCWGVPCRYVSGYLGPEVEGEDTGESHAWVECWFPGVRWTGFDPTNNIEGDERHVRVAVGRDYEDVPPNRGVFRGNGGSELTSEVKIERHTEIAA